MPQGVLNRILCFPKIGKASPKGQKSTTCLLKTRRLSQESVCVLAFLLEYDSDACVDCQDLVVDTHCPALRLGDQVPSFSCRASTVLADILMACYRSCWSAGHDSTGPRENINTSQTVQWNTFCSLFCNYSFGFWCPIEFPLSPQSTHFSSSRNSTAQ